MVHKNEKPLVLGKYLSIFFLLILLVLTYFIVKPFIFTIIFGLILAYILSPVYGFLNKKIKNKNLASFFLILILFLVISIGGFYFVNAIVNEAKDVFLAIKSTEIGTTEIEELLNSPYVKPIFEKSTLSIVQKGTDFLVALPLFFLNLIIMLFVLFYAFKESDVGKRFVDILPLSKKYREELYKEVKKISAFVLYGFVLMGIIQGIVGGISFYIFDVPNPLFWTAAMIIASILPIGPWLVWIPAALFKFFTGEVSAGIGLAIFGILITNNIDLFLRPIIIKKKADIHPLVILIGGLGGLIAFGALGLIIGPLIIAFLTTFFRVYKEENKTF